MAKTQSDNDRWFSDGTLGQARSVTPGVAAVNNATALDQGRYLLTVVSGTVHVQGPAAETVTATTADTPLIAGETWTFVTGSVAAQQFVSVIRAAAGAVFTVCGADPFTALAQPADWT